MKFTKQIRFDLDITLFQRIEREASENKSEFIRQAIEEKLNKRRTEQLGLQKMVRQIEKMDPQAMHGTLSDLVYTTRVLYEKLIEHDFLLKEIKEQTSQEHEEDYEEGWAEEDEQEEFEIQKHAPHDLSQYEKDQLMIDEYYKSVEQRYKK